MGGWGWAELKQEDQPEMQAVGCATVSVWIRDASFRTHVRELGKIVGDPVVSCCKVGGLSHLHEDFGDGGGRSGTKCPIHH